MSKDLVIVESPAKARTISRILGDEYKVLASAGHIRDLPERRPLGIDVENDFKPSYAIIPEKRPVVNSLKKAASGSKIIYLATDPDREGEAIAWHLSEVLGAEDERYRRVTFHELTRPAVEHAFSEPGVLNTQLVDAQQARRVLDRLVGFRVSPILWGRFHDNALSAGRVQSVALRLICTREQEIEAFVPEEYWNLTASFIAEGATFAAKLARVDDAKAVVGNGEEAERLQAATRTGKFQVGKVSRTRRKQKPQPPFITSTLQQAASSNLRMSTSQTMQIAQQLYEGIEIDGEPVGLITYMRTDSVNVSKVAQEAASEFIADTFGKEYLPAKARSYRSRSGAQEAHEAIRPTDITLTPDALKSHGLSSQQLKLYTLIWSRFVASQMNDSESEIHALEITGGPAGGPELVYRASASKLLFAGYQKVYNLQDTDDADGDDGDGAVPDLAQGQDCGMKECAGEQKFTEPPPRFSEATLVRELEKNGIGRPSTYAAIIRTLLKRYVSRVQRKLEPTEIGRNVNEFLVRQLSQLFAVDFTAKMEDDLDLVEQGEREWVTMMRGFYGDLEGWLEEALALPDPAVMKQLLELFHDDIEYAEPTRGNREFNDRKFVSDLKERLEKGQKLSERQWNAALGVMVKYEAQLSGLDAVAADVDLLEALNERRAAMQERDGDGPSSEAVALSKALASVSEWEPPSKKGRRTFDDSEFYLSLKDRIDSGKALSEKQEYSLRTLAEKYCEQISDYSALAEKWSLVALETRNQQQHITRSLLAMADEIKEFPEPVKRGRRVFDEKEFVTSLKEQFAAKGQLSERQVAALQKLLGRHAQEIADFDGRADKLGLKPTTKDTGRMCPDCDDGKLLERNSRGRIFYGCSNYPKCRFTVKNLSELEAPVSDES